MSPEPSSDRASSSDEVTADIIEGSPTAKEERGANGFWYDFYIRILISYVTNFFESDAFLSNFLSSIQKLTI